MKLILKYVGFAGLSTAVNLLTQILFIALYKGIFAVEISIFLGTLFGVPIRYYLEKKYIFCYFSENFNHDFRVFVLYNCMGVFTTLIFWSFEYGFHIIFRDHYMRYLGAIIGLSIGYFIKYQLDKKYVFVHKVKREAKS